MDFPTDPLLSWEYLSIQTTVGHTLHISELDGRVARRKLLIEESHKKAHLQRAAQTTQQTRASRCSGQMTPTLTLSLRAKRYVWLKTNVAHYPHCESWWQHHVVGLNFFNRAMEPDQS
ncbi:hypothetical protein AMECASPLE_024066 [Ameca splendens]|uniref:Uncharacterized protein n=1 Tax=Ameca splendens TaxID=208324 RepID=A0ABV0Z359_9TELE